MKLSEQLTSVCSRICNQWTDRGLLLKDLAERISVTPEHLARLQRGQRTPSLQTLDLLLQATKTEIRTELKEHTKDDGYVLSCPKCDGNNLHQREVQAYFREEDAETGRYCKISKQELATGQSMAGNPSKRRDGILVALDCESCQETSAMSIVQHKGETIIAFEDSYRSLKSEDFRGA